MPTFYFYSASEQHFFSSSGLYEMFLQCITDSPTPYSRLKETHAPLILNKSKQGHKNEPKMLPSDFLPKSFNMGIYLLAWTPAIMFQVIWTPWPNFGSKGPLAPTRPNNMEVYELAWTPAIILKVIWSPRPDFGSKGPLALNSKVCHFLTMPHIMDVYRLTWPQQ